MSYQNGGSAVRPEHPRPDFRGRSWLNLNGFWNFKFDDYDQGEKEGWQRGGGEFDRKILVPFPFQSKLSGIQDESFHNMVWYQRGFSIPESFSGKRMLLHFGAVDYETKVWLNGNFLGSHRGGYTPFSFDITNHVKEENSLVLRVLDAHGDQPRGKQDANLHPRGCVYMRVTGIWQTVWLEAVGEAYVASVQITPDVDNSKINVSINLGGEAEGCKVLATVYFNSVEEAKAEGDVKAGSSQ
ncbi:MAG: glycoside hydrolase family 2, partial [Candidatus Bathyarchaeia archaeon]